MKKVCLVIALLIIFSLVVVPAGVALAISGTESQITTSPADQLDPSISGNIISYTDRRNADADIYYYNTSAKQEVQVTSGNGDQMLSEVDGDWIVYTDFGRGNADACAYNIVSGLSIRLTDNPANQRKPNISGDLVVYEDDRSGNWDIYLFDLNTNTETRLTSDPADQRKPTISGSKVVWEDYRGGNSDVYMIDITTSAVTQITNSAAQETDPDIDGDIVVFFSNQYSVGDVYYYRISNGQTVVVTAGPDYERNPTVSGDYIAYESYASGNSHIWLYRISSGVITQATTNTANQYLHDLSGHRLVYTDDHNGNLDIYLYEFTEGPRIEVSPLTYSFGNKNLGSSTTAIVSIYNNGDSNLTVTITDPLNTPYYYKVDPGLNLIPPGETKQVYVTYQPNVLGSSLTTLKIYSNDPNSPLVEVHFSGNCVQTEDPPSQQIADILVFFDQSVSNGTLLGSGPGNSAQGRLNALRNMIEAAGDLIAQGNIQQAKQQLQDAYLRVDGQPRPPDFATGDAALTLAAMIQQLINSL